MDIDESDVTTIIPITKLGAKYSLSMQPEWIEEKRLLIINHCRNTVCTGTLVP